MRALRKSLVIASIFFLLVSDNAFLVSDILAATSAWSQSDWSGGSFSSSSNVTTSTANQVTLNKSEKLSNTGFETDLTGWSTRTTNFSDSSFLAANGAVAAWPMDDTTSAQSYARAVNPAVSTGRNIVINGTFDTDTIWTKGTGWVILAGMATHAVGSTSNLTQSSIVVIGKVYQVTFSVSGYVSGNVKACTSSCGISRTSNGTFTETLLADATSFIIQGSSDFVGSVDDIFVTQLNVPASNATPTQLLADGDMETNGTGSWTAGGSSGASLNKGSSSPHGGSRVLRVTSAGSGVVYAFQNVLTVGNVYRVMGYARSDGTSALPRVYTAGGTTTLFTGSSSTSWQPFDFVFKAAATDIDFGHSGINGQYTEWDDVVVALDTGVRSGETQQDGGLEQWVSATDAVLWSEGPTGSSTVNRTTDSHSGTYAVRLDVDGLNSSVSFSQIGIISNGKTYKVGFWAKSNVNGATISFDWTTNSVSLTTNYAYYEVIGVANGLSAFNLKRGSGDANASLYIDDITVSEVPPIVGKNKNGVTVGASSGTGGHLTNAYSFDGVDDVVDIYSTDLNSAFNPNEGTLVAWAKVASAGVWTDGALRYLVNITGNANNYIYLRKSSGNNLFSLIYGANGVQKRIDTTGTFAPTTWQQYVITWSKSNDQVKAYVNGAQIGSTLTGLGAWVGNLATTAMAIGAFDNSGTTRWSGLINDVRLYNRALSGSEISALYNGVNAARDTTIKLTGSASAKVAAPEGAGTFVQNVNVGDTNSYNISANVYTNGSAVTSSDAVLYYNGSTVPTTYTSIGGGWYKLTGTVTGVASSVEAGVQVSGGKTVYVDDVSLNNYSSSGTLTSSIFDSGQASNWGALSYSVTTPTNTTFSIKVRTGNRADLSDASAFSSCNAISNSATVGGSNCAANGTRYAQYQLSLASSDLLNTPTFTSFSLPFTTSFTVDLDSPGNNSYTNNQRPTFAWKKTNASGGVGKYILQIDDPKYSIIVDNIPVDRSSDLVTSKYLIHYDTSLISFYTKSTSDWAPTENDGKLNEGTINWKVTAVDTAGNATSSTRSFYIDTTKPTISGVSVSGGSRPTVSGVVNDSGSGIDKIEVKIEKQNIFGGWDLYLDANINEITDSKFSFTPADTLPSGNYRATAIAMDKAGNSASSDTVKFSIGGITSLFATPTPSPAPVSSEPGPSEVPSATATATATATAAPFKPISINININYLLNPLLKSYENIAFSLQKFSVNIGGDIAYIYTRLANFGSNSSLAIARWINNKNLAIGDFVIGQFNYLTSTSTGIFKVALTSAGNAIAFANSTTYRYLLAVTSETASLAENVSSGVGRFRTGVLRGVSELAFNLGGKARNFSDFIGTGIVNIGYLFETEPTTISDVRVSELTSTSVKISWKTNYPATGKVNYGLDETYPYETQSTKLTKDHEFVISGLKPGTQYFFEVMSQGKNYVYDANRKFTTLP